MNDGGNAMSEKEFVEKLLQYFWVEVEEDHIDNFLEEFHKEYYEVEFIKKEDNIAGIPIVTDESIPDSEIHLKDGNEVIAKLIIK